MAQLPVARAYVFNDAVEADTDILSAAITPRSGTAAFRVTIVLVSTNSVVNLQISDGSATIEADLNAGTELTAGVLYKFTFVASSNLTYNFQAETGTTIGLLLVDELKGEVAA